MKCGKIITVILAAGILAAACGGCGTEAVDYYNRTHISMQWFSLGDVIYRGSIYSPPTQYHSGFDAPLRGLCRDPLCSHDDADAPCPDYHSFILRSYCTDGKKIYFSAIDNSNSGMYGVYRKIYYVNPDGTEFRLLSSNEFLSGSSGSYYSLVYYDRYLYYQQSMYDDTTGEETIALMRVSTDGGAPEEVLGFRFNPGIAHFVDGEYYYILDTSPNFEYEQSLTLIDRKTGGITENLRPEGYGVESVQIYRDKTYIICAECIPEKEYATLTSVTPLRAYRFSDGEFELLAGNLISYTFSDGAFWFTPFELEYYGTVQSPTGKGNETAPCDIIRSSGNTLTRVDLSDGTTQTWTFDRFDEGYVPTLLGISDGIAVVSMSSAKLRFENYKTGESTAVIHKYKLNSDGTVSDLGGFES